jgi:hypothetical protein
MVIPVAASVSVLVAGVPFAVVATGGALWAAEDTSTGVLLTTMHLVTRTAFAITVWRARRRAGVSRIGGQTSVARRVVPT